MSSKDESSSDSGIMMLKYQTDDVIVPGQNIHRIDDEVTNSITSNFVIDLSANRQLAHQRIVYQLTQVSPENIISMMPKVILLTARQVVSIVVVVYTNAILDQQPNLRLSIQLVAMINQRLKVTIL